MPLHQTQTTSRLSFPLEETTFITVSNQYKSPDLTMLKQHTRIWEDGHVSKTTLYQRLQIPHSLPACNFLNISNPTFSQLGSSIPPPPSPLLPILISSNLSPPFSLLPSQLGSSIPPPPSPLLPILISSNLSPPSSLLPSQLNSSIPQSSFSLPQLDTSIPQPSFQLPYQLNLPSRLIVFPLCHLMEQSSVTSSLSDPATSLPESQDTCRDTTSERKEQSSVTSSLSDPSESQDICRDTAGGRSGN